MYRLGLAPPSSLSEVFLVWPLEVLLTIAVGLGALVTPIIYAHPMPLLWVDMGPAWAWGWMIMALVAAALLIRGLWKGDLSAMGAGLLMGGLLLGGYLLVAIFNDSVYPTVIAISVLGTLSSMSVARGIYYQRIVSRARRGRHRLQG